jgi:hypothetical protein
MFLSVLAVAAGLSAHPLAAPRIPVSEPTADAAKQVEARVIYLGCQVTLTSLTDCHIVNEGPVDPTAAATALKISQQMTIPAELAQRTGGHIVVKLNVTP